MLIMKRWGRVVWNGLVRCKWEQSMKKSDLIQFKPKSKKRGRGKLKILLVEKICWLKCERWYGFDYDSEVEEFMWFITNSIV